MRSRAMLAAAAALSLVAGEVAAEPHFDAGRRLLKQRRYTEAIAELELAYQAEPRGEPLYDIALAYQLFGNRAKAVEYYRKFLGVETKGRMAETAQRYATALEAELAADAAEAQRQTDLRAAEKARASQLATSAHSVDGAAAKLRYDVASRHVTDLDTQLKLRGASRDAAKVAADKAHEDADRAEASLASWRSDALAAPAGAGRAPRLLGTIAMVGGASMMAAGAWYGLDASDISDKLSAATEWKDVYDPLTVRGQRSDDRIKVLLPAGGALLILGTIAFGWGELETSDKRPAAAVRKQIEGGKP
jgi:tetratricopeptide (TPR) repeat protein